MKKVIILILALFLSCKSQSTSPDTSEGGAISGGDNNTETPPTTNEDVEKYGIDIDTATAETIKAALEKYYKDKGEYKVIFTGTSTKSYDRYASLGTVIDEIKDITDITVSFENVIFQNNKLPDYILGSTSFDNNNITKVILPEYITVFGEYVFARCHILEEVNIPKSLIEIGGMIFFETGVKNIDLPNGLRIINDYAFDGSAIESIDIPDSVTSMGIEAFKSCPQLQSVKLSKNLTVIPKSAFASCSALKTITIPEAVTSIEDLAFYVCNGAENVVFEGTNPKLITIGNNAFGYCEKLTTITIPANVKNIEDIAFKKCFLLTSITFLSPTPPSMNGSRIFESTPLENVYVPKGAVEAYKALKGKGLPQNVNITEIQ